MSNKFTTKESVHLFHKIVNCKEERNKNAFLKDFLDSEKNKNIDIHKDRSDFSQGDIDAIKDLLDVEVKNKDMDINTIKDRFGLSLMLHYAWDRPNIAVVKLLLDYKPDIKEKYHGVPLFIYLIINKVSRDMLELLYDYEPNIINQKGVYGYTALHHAAHEGTVDNVRFLLEKGANTDTKDRFGNTPLHVITNMILGKDNRVMAEERSSWGSPQKPQNWLEIAEALVKENPTLVHSTNLDKKNSLTYWSRKWFCTYSPIITRILFKH